MLSKSENLIKKINDLLEELYFPTKLQLREMTPSEVAVYKATPFPNGDLPCIGSFLNVHWLVILDYTGLIIKSMTNPNEAYIAPYHTRASSELASVCRSILDELVSLTSEEQLYDNNFLEKHKFVRVSVARDY